MDFRKIKIYTELILFDIIDKQMTNNDSLNQTSTTKLPEQSPPNHPPISIPIATHTTP